MRMWKAFVPAVVAAAFTLCAPKPAAAQIAVQIGPAPVCPYGYYDYSPYQCAPYGYYGPEWFDNGVFIGAGPWYHGRHDFHGHVDNRYDPHHGYHGPYPERGEHYQAHDNFRNFHGNEMRDGHGEYRGEQHGNRDRDDEHHH